MEGAGSVLAREAPDLRFRSTSPTPVRPGLGRSPALDQAIAYRLGTDLGEGRIRRMDEHASTYRSCPGRARSRWCPPYRLGKVLDFIDGLDLTAEERAAPTHRNAERLFGL